MSHGRDISIEKIRYSKILRLNDDVYVKRRIIKNGNKLPPEIFIVLFIFRIGITYLSIYQYAYYYSAIFIKRYLFE